MDLCTLDQARAWLKITNLADDPLLETLITQTSEYIRSVLSRDLDSRQYTDVLDGTGGSTLALSNYPVTAVSAVSVDGVSWSPSLSYGATGYQFDLYRVMLINGVFPKKQRNVTITYTAGYTVIPADIQQVCIELVGKKYRERDRIGQTSKTLAGEIVSFSPTDLTPELKSRLRQYQKVVPV